MFQKVLSTIAVALAIGGAVALTPSQAEAGNSLTVGGDWGYVQIGSRDGYRYGKRGAYDNGGYRYGSYEDTGYRNGKYGYGGGKGYRGKYKGGYGSKGGRGSKGVYGYKAGNGDYPACHTKWKRKKVRYWNDYNNCWEYKVVHRPYRVCH
jgi:hypothetical protein